MRRSARDAEGNDLRKSKAAEPMLAPGRKGYVQERRASNPPSQDPQLASAVRVWNCILYKISTTPVPVVFKGKYVRLHTHIDFLFYVWMHLGPSPPNSFQRAALDVGLRSTLESRTPFSELCFGVILLTL